MVMYADADEYFKQQVFSMISEEVNFSSSRLEGEPTYGATPLQSRFPIPCQSYEARL